MITAVERVSERSIATKLDNGAGRISLWEQKGWMERIGCRSQGGYSK